MNDVTVLIVDDEALARQGLQGFLADEPGVRVIGACRSGREAIEAIRTITPDLVFLDVQMPEVDGFDVVAALGHGWVPAIVFVTAYDEYAVQAFEVNAVDYLLKPFDRVRFRTALDRARRRVAFERGTMAGRIAELLETVGAGRRYVERFLVRTGGRVYFVPAAEVEWIEAADNYARLHADGRIHPVRETMRGLEWRLDPACFVRVHRSAIVRMDRIVELRPLPSGDSTLVLRSGASVTLSRGYRDRFRERMG